MSLIEDELSIPFSDRVTFKHNREKGFNSGISNRETARLMISKAPETMVKVTGFSRGTGGIIAHLKYIGRAGNVELENERGEIYTNSEDIKALADDWMQDINRNKSYKRQRDVMHLTLSMPKGTNPQSVKDAARSFALNQFAHNHEYVFALHTDTPHPHVHLAVKMQGLDLSRINPQKAVLQHWREEFASELRAIGVSAVATPRKARGQIKKPINGIVYHLNKGDETHPKKTAKITASHIKETTLEILAENQGEQIKSKPWLKGIKQAQLDVKKAYRNVIKLLNKTGKSDDKQLAQHLENFLENMPEKARTQNTEMRQKIYDDIMVSRIAEDSISDKLSQQNEKIKDSITKQKPEQDYDR